MLKDLQALDEFLDSIYYAAPLPVSIKTRLGFSEPEEFPALLEIFNKYPVKALTNHPRVRNQFYNGNVDTDAFAYAVSNSKNPLCYNGNLCSKADIAAFEKQYPSIDAVMLGRGLIANPGMLTPGGTTMDALEDFHNELLATYTQVFGSERNAMFRMKENWRHFLCNFENSEKLGKRLRKATTLSEYKATTAEIFRTLPLRKELLPDW
jgi:tRNA-dihydrouridine synthase